MLCTERGGKGFWSWECGQLGEGLVGWHRFWQRERERDVSLWGWFDTCIRLVLVCGGEARVLEQRTLGELGRLGMVVRGMVVRGMCGVFEGWERGGGHLVCRGQSQESRVGVV